MTTIRLKRGDLGPEGFVIRHLAVDEGHQVIIGKQVELVEFDDVLFRVMSSIVLPDGVTPSTLPEAERPGALRATAACLRYARAHPEKRVLVAGHTDTAGTEELNVALSRQRALAVWGLLAGDRETFRLASDGPHVPDRAEKTERFVHDRIQVLDWVAARLGWPCSFTGNHNDYFAAVRQFQRSYNAHGHAGNAAAADLAVDADFGPACWGAVFDCYQVELARLLGVEPAGLATFRHLTFLSPGSPTVACGESMPIDQVGRYGYRSQANRRVEVMFFDPGEEPDLPCLGAACNPAACELGHLAFFHRRHLPITVTADSVFRVRLCDHDLQPYRSRHCLLLHGGHKVEDMTDEDGVFEVPFPPDLREGRVTVWPEAYPDGPQVHWAIEVAALPPAGEVRGAMLRLRNLGYCDGPIVDTATEAVRDVLRLFQSDWEELDVTGALDPPTIAKLEELHDRE